MCTRAEERENMELYRVFNWAGDPLVYTDPLVLNVGQKKLLWFLANNGFNQVIEYDDGVCCPLFTLASGKISDWAVPDHPKGRDVIEHKSKCALDITELLKHAGIDLDNYDVVSTWKTIRSLLFKNESGKSPLMVAIPPDPKGNNKDEILVSVGTFRGMSSAGESKIQEITEDVPKLEFRDGKDKKKKLDFNEIELTRTGKALETDIVLDLESFEVIEGNSNTPKPILLKKLDDFSYATDVTSRHFAIEPYLTRPIVFKDSKGDYKILGMALEEDIKDYEFNPKTYTSAEQQELHTLTKYLLKRKFGDRGNKQ